MLATATVRFKLNTTPDQFRTLRQTQLAYRDALDFMSRYAFAHGKTSNKVGLQEDTSDTPRGLKPHGFSGYACPNELR